MVFQLGCWPFFPPTPFSKPLCLLPTCPFVPCLPAALLPYTSSLRAALGGPPMILRLQGMPATHGLKTGWSWETS